MHLRVTASAENEKACRKLIKPVVKELKKRFGENVFATDESKTLEEAVIDLLKEKDLKLSLAESLTGGMIAQRIVNVSGASEVFGYGFVTYSNKAKHKCLGVKKRTLKEQGAVSAKCAREMAKGACKASGADISISVTGLAGPGGGTRKLRLVLYLWAAAIRARLLPKSSTLQEIACGSASRLQRMHWRCYVTVSL